MATHPSVLLLDEPAAGLGERESKELASLVRSLPDEWGMGLLLVEHDMNFVMCVCDEIVVLDFGKTIATGEPRRRSAATRLSSPPTSGRPRRRWKAMGPRMPVPKGASNV